MIIYGLLLVFNGASFGDLANGTVYTMIRDRAGLYILWLMIGISSSITQVRILGEQMKMAQEYWNSSMTFDEFLVSNSSNVKKTKSKKK